MDVEEWFKKNRYHCDSYSDIKRLVQIKKKKKLKISLIIPTLNEELTIGKTLKIVDPLVKKKLLDEIIVIDSGSTDNTKKIVEHEGVKFVYSSEVLKKELGEIKGKGENLWKSLYVAEGDIIVWIDADIKNIHSRFVYGLIGPLLTNKRLAFTKAFYQRPIKVGEELVPLGGGRVTELTARPLFNLYFPRLSGFIQPLSGEYAGRREVLEKIPFFTGYGVETAMLIDLVQKFGLNKIAQVDLKKRIHRNQPLASLTKMSFGIMQVFSKRADVLGKLILVKKLRKNIRIIGQSKDDYTLIKKRIQDKERPPMITVDAYRKKFKKDPKWVYA